MHTMHSHDEHLPPAGTATALRGDVRSARSRMRTKYGSQLQIVALADVLDETETLRFMAVASGPSLPDRKNHGLLALSDRRVLFVPKTSAYDRVSHDLSTIHALFWTKGGRVGTLTVLGDGYSCSFTEVATADGRELMALAVQVAPHIKRAGTL